MTDRESKFDPRDPADWITLFCIILVLAACSFVLAILGIKFAQAVL